MPTVQDVAQLAGVSTATVSRTLSKPDIVTNATRDKVMRAVNQLGFVPNHSAQSLRTLRSSKIMLTVPDISNTFFANIIRGAEEAALAAGYAVLIGDTKSDPDREDLYAGMLHRKEADGLIFLGYRLPETVKEILQRKGARAPVVNGCEFSPELGVSSVHIDNVGAASEGMDLLYSLGHQRVGVISGPLVSPLSRDRLNGVRTSAARHRFQKQLTVATGDFSAESGEREALTLLKRAPRPTAIFCFSDEMSVGVLRALRKLGLRCPEEVSVMGFDDIRFAQFVTPALTTIYQPTQDIGREAVRLLIGILEGTITKRANIVLPHSLVIRDSTAPPPR